MNMVNKKSTSFDYYFGGGVEGIEYMMYMIELLLTIWNNLQALYQNMYFVDTHTMGIG